MNRKIVLQDLMKSKFISFTTALFIASAALLISLAAVLTVNLGGAVDRLMTAAKTPHFMQMHAGALDFGALERFAAQRSETQEFQVLKFLNLDNSRIRLGDQFLTGSTQDHGLSVQSGSFDYLLGLDDTVIVPADGELYVPVSYLQNHTAKLHDTAVICGKEFKIAGFFRDSQMNSMLASSKRFLVSEHDFQSLSAFGTMEYLIEFRLKDPSLLDSFATAYHAAKLPSNGPSITYPLIRMINALSDGMMIGVILLVSILAAVIALICIRFTLLIKIEEDYDEIGVMKAIGLRVSDIKTIYLTKYALITAAGCIAGFLLSFLFKEPLLKNMRLLMGKSVGGPVSYLPVLLGILLLVFAVLLFVNGILQRFRQISIPEAVHRGGPRESTAGKARLSLRANRFLSANVFLGIQDILSRPKLYTANLFILIFAVFMMMIPLNLVHTLSDDSFVTYMGIGSCDLRIDVRQNSRMREQTSKIDESMAKNASISNHTVLITKAFQLLTDDGGTETLPIELGNHLLFPVSYDKGHAPSRTDEIALSSMQAKELRKTIGDPLTLVTKDGTLRLSVCGIYSDITNGGKTAKAAFMKPSEELMWSIVYASLNNPDDIPETVKRYAAQFSNCKVTDIKDYVAQTYGQTLRSLKRASAAAMAASLIITAFITLLFARLLTAKDRYSIAVIKVCGFTVSDIRRQYLVRFFLVLVLGIILGTILTATAGKLLVGAVFASFGADSFRFTVNPFTAYVLCPLLLTACVLGASMAGTADIRQIPLSTLGKE